jgi:hypothetical protein
MTRPCHTAAAIFIWPLLLSYPLSAQLSVDLGPMLAYYRPVGQFDEASIYSTSLPRHPADLSSGAYGAEARLWIRRRLGVQVQAATASSRIRKGWTPLGEVGPTPARVLSLSAQGLYAFLPHDKRYSAWFSGGFGYVHHGGKAYEPYDSTTDLAAVLGVGGTVGIRGPLRASGGLGILLYPFDVPMPDELRLNPGSMQHGFQEDILMHIGVSWRTSIGE